MTNTQLYSVFLIKSNSLDDAIFLFKFKQDPKTRPTVGDSLINPASRELFKIIRDELNPEDEKQIRVTDDTPTFRRRVTDNGDLRIIAFGGDLDSITHFYYVTPANNPNRISSYTSSRFSNDQTLKQLFR